LPKAEETGSCIFGRVKKPLRKDLWMTLYGGVNGGVARYINDRGLERLPRLRIGNPIYHSRSMSLDPSQMASHLEANFQLPSWCPNPCVAQTCTSLIESFHHFLPSLFQPLASLMFLKRHERFHRRRFALAVLSI
jgi:hypothetical protein